jgi:hypothetical protein
LECVLGLLHHIGMEWNGNDGVCLMRVGYDTTRNVREPWTVMIHVNDM